MRDAFGRALESLAVSEPRLMVLDADNAPATRTARFGAAYPERFVNVGCAEQNLVGVAAGLALMGFPIVASTFAVFLCGRAFEQIRNSVCRPELPVTLVGTHAGITVGADGSSHMTVEDIAVMRSLPGMQVLVPSTDRQIEPLLAQAIASRRPAYLRLSRHQRPDRGGEAAVTIGGAERIVTGEDLTLVACGVAVERCLTARAELRERGIAAEVIDAYSLKPLAAPVLVESARRTRAVVAVEEHGPCGGLGEAVAAVLGASEPVAFEAVCLHETFGRSGEAEQLLDTFGLGVADIVRASERCVARSRLHR